MNKKIKTNFESFKSSFKENALVSIVLETMTEKRHFNKAGLNRPSLLKAYQFEIWLIVMHVFKDFNNSPHSLKRSSRRLALGDCRPKTTAKYSVVAPDPPTKPHE